MLVLVGYNMIHQPIKLLQLNAAGNAVRSIVNEFQQLLLFNKPV